MSTRLGPGRFMNEYGYIRVRVPGTRRLRMEHVVVWEAVNGPVPKGMELHHVNEDKADNRIENLRLVDRLTHKRIHSGCIMRDGAWLKPCPRCGAFQPIENYYRKPDGITSMCKACLVRRIVRRKQLKKAFLAERREARACDSGRRETPEPSGVGEGA